MKTFFTRLKHNIPWPIGILLLVILSAYSLLVILLAFPFLFAYEKILPTIASRRSKKSGKDVVVILNKIRDPHKSVGEILRSTGERATLLDYSERKNWPRFNMAVHLFNMFGPHVKPDFMTPDRLPGVIVLN